MTTYFTQNPIGSTDPRDLYDNAENLDEAVNNTESDSWRDRMGRDRLTWEAIAKAGTGDTGVAIDAANRAVGAAGQAENEADRAAGAASRAENAEAVVDATNIQNYVAQAETARDAAFVNADVYPSFAEGVSGTTEGQQFQVISGNGLELIRYERTATGAIEVARYPTVDAVSGMRAAPTYGFIAGTTAGSLALDTTNKTITLHGRVISGKRTYNITTPVVLSYSELSANHVVTVSLLTGEGRLTAASSMGGSEGLPDDHAVLGVISPSSDELFGVAKYTIDGKKSSDAAMLGRQGTVYGANTNLRMDTAAMTIQFVSLRLRSAGGVNVVIPNQTISYAAHYASSSIRYLAYNLDTQEVLIRTNIQGVALENLVFFGAFHPVTTQFFGIPGGYQVDSFLRGGLAMGGATGTFYGSPEGVKIDTELNTLTVGGFSSRLAFGVGTYELGGLRTVDIVDMFSPQLLVYSGRARDLRLVPRANVLQDTTDSDIIFAELDPVTYKIKGLPGGYMVNGHVVDESNSADAVTKKTPALGWDVAGVYTAPELISYDSQAPLHGNDITTADIYGWFDALQVEHPEYITKTHLGNEATGLPIYEYRFSPDRAKTDNTRCPRIMIQGGIHNEVMSYIYPYHAMKLICDNWEEDSLLEALRWGAEFSVIPALNAWGIDNGSRYNSNNVNLNRNYPAGWVSSGDNPGPAPLSELEAQYSKGVIDSFAPDIFIDCHSFGTQTTGEKAGNFLWFPPVGDGRATDCGYAMVNRLARKWATEHEWVPPASVLTNNSQTLAPGGAAYYPAALGKLSATFETGTRILGEPSGQRFSEITVRYATESLINFLIITLRKYM